MGGVSGVRVCVRALFFFRKMPAREGGRKRRVCLAMKEKEVEGSPVPQCTGPGCQLEKIDPSLMG